MAGNLVGSWLFLSMKLMSNPIGSLSKNVNIKIEAQLYVMVLPSGWVGTICEAAGVIVNLLSYPADR